MEITKEQVLDIYNTNSFTYKLDMLEKWFPEAFKVELEVGKFYTYETTKCIVKITELHKEDFAGYGFNYLGEFVCKEKNWTNGFDGWQEGTTEEWESALIEEAKKRGLYDAQYFKHANNLTVNNGESGFVESIDKNKIWTKYGCVYHKGVWAEIIKTFSKEEAEDLLGGKII